MTAQKEALFSWPSVSSACDEVATLEVFLTVTGELSLWQTRQQALDPFSSNSSSMVEVKNLGCKVLTRMLRDAAFGVGIAVAVGLVVPMFIPPVIAALNGCKVYVRTKAAVVTTTSVAVACGVVQELLDLREQRYAERHAD
jgi:hypothetical protein